MSEFFNTIPTNVVSHVGRFLDARSFANLLLSSKHLAQLFSSPVFWQQLWQSEFQWADNDTTELIRDAKLLSLLETRKRSAWSFEQSFRAFEPYAHRRYFTYAENEAASSHHSVSELCVKLHHQVMLGTYSYALYRFIRVQARVRTRMRTLACFALTCSTLLSTRAPLTMR